MLKHKETIQGRIFRMLGFLLMAIVSLTAISFYALYEAQGPFQRAMQETKHNRAGLMTVRLALEQTIKDLELAGSASPELAGKRISGAQESAAQFHTALETLIKENQLRPWVDELKKINDLFTEAEAFDRSAALSAIESKAGASKIFQVTRLDDLRRSLSETNIVVERSQELDLLNAIKSMAIMILPIAIAVIIIPVASFWATTKRINRDLLSYVRSLYTLSEQNDQTSESLTSASEALSSASNQQSAAVQETVSSITEIRSMLAETENHVREVQLLTATMNDKTQDGTAIMSRLEASMRSIEEANQQLQSFEEIIQSIRGKTQVINDIVFKTQLLSFNASIEAARAGQYGRGFSVVAEEVGKLAQMSGDASKEIDHLLGTSQQRVVKIIEAVKERVTDGKKVSGEALLRFGEIAKEISVISDKVNQVGEATVEQAGGVEQTAKAMEQMNQSALENKSSSEEIFKIADRVLRLSVKIRDVTEGVRRFVREEDSQRKEKDSPRAPTIDPPKASGSGDSNSAKVPPRVIKLVERLSHRRASLSGSKSDPMEGFSADDPSFRKTIDRK